MVDISTEAETKNGESPSGDVPSPLTDQADPGGITGDPAGDVAGQIDSKNGNLEESAAATDSPPPDAPADAPPEDAAGEPDLEEMEQMRLMRRRIKVLKSLLMIFLTLNPKPN